MSMTTRMDSIEHESMLGAPTIQQKGAAVAVELDRRKSRAAPAVRRAAAGEGPHEQPAIRKAREPVRSPSAAGPCAGIC